MMDNKKLGLYFVVFAVLYFIFTALIVGHGVHFLNSLFTVGILITGVYFYVKNE